MEQPTLEVEPEPFLEVFRGGCSGILRWPQLDELWQVVKADADAGWYIYAVGEQVPDTPATRPQIIEFIKQIDKLLHDDHNEDYCGIVYTDDRAAPGFVKIYDPNNLGVVCGSSEEITLPGWILSKLKPVDLPSALPQTASRRRWWRRLFK